MKRLCLFFLYLRVPCAVLFCVVLYYTRYGYCYILSIIPPYLGYLFTLRNRLYA
ncbi:hypothetical protein F4809DRAFT_612468 [Biscogniauxia mediterranea]|nr:hypothetical protein F4809DRAFT_612468 [Biscogniauxia mediterranea]